MDTVTYASVAALPNRIVKNAACRIVPEVEFVPLDLACLRQSWFRLFQTTGPCNDL